MTGFTVDETSVQSAKNELCLPACTMQTTLRRILEFRGEERCDTKKALQNDDKHKMSAKQMRCYLPYKRRGKSCLSFL
jgi:hypothetical protein